MGTTAFKRDLVRDHRDRLALRELDAEAAGDVKPLQWQEALAAGMQKAGKSLADASGDCKSAPWKVALAAHLKAPADPVPPQSQLDRMYRGLSAFAPRLPEIPVISPPASHFLRRTNSFEFGDKISRVKHGHAEKVHPLILTFQSYAAAASFTIDYKITAANVPEAITGSLHVRVEKT